MTVDMLHMNSPSLTDTHDSTAIRQCLHCTTEFTCEQSSDEKFCCQGCAGVWRLIHGLGLAPFYAMTGGKSLEKAHTPQQDYSIFDTPSFQSDFVRDNSKGSEKTAELLIEGISCYACVWLIRQALLRRFPRIDVQINQATGAASITWDPQAAKLSELVAHLETLGYKVLPHRGQRLATDANQLIRVGVGLFMMMNVMSFALAEYFTGRDGLDPSLKSYLRWFSAALTVITLAWPGREFFVHSWQSAVARRPNIDAPILIGLLGAFAYSLLNTWRGSGDIYYDSICAIIALVVTGRFVQQVVLRRNQTRMAALIEPGNGYVLVARDGRYIQERATNIQPGDHLRILPGELIPLKVQCVTSCGEISYEQLRGEPGWQSVHAGQTLIAGTLNGGSALDVTASEAGTSSYMTSLQKLIERALSQKGQYQRWSDQAAWLLFGVVLLVAAGVVLMHAATDPQEGIRRGIAILLVACPCTFALGTPLTFSTAMSQALGDGILFRSQRAIETLANVQNFIFDKTGTLTFGKPQVTTVQMFAPWENNRDMLVCVLSKLDQHSSHHAPNAIATWAKRLKLKPKDAEIVHTAEDMGQGLMLLADNHVVRLGRKSWLESSGIKTPDDCDGHVWLAIDDACAGSFTLEDTLRPESQGVITALQNAGCTSMLLSGDSTYRTTKIATRLGLSQSIGNATPVSKSLTVRRKLNDAPVAMVGNGLNDAAAMAAATVGIAVGGASDSAHSSADICLLRSDMQLVSRALSYSRMTMKRVRRAFAFAVAYNCLTMTLAAFGYVTPVVAALLMPISSITMTRIATSWKLAPLTEKK